MYYVYIYICISTHVLYIYTHVYIPMYTCICVDIYIYYCAHIIHMYEYTIIYHIRFDFLASFYLSAAFFVSAQKNTCRFDVSKSQNAWTGQAVDRRCFNTGLRGKRWPCLKRWKLHVIAQKPLIGVDSYIFPIWGFP